jgi:hypothetical protein
MTSESSQRVMIFDETNVSNYFYDKKVSLAITIDVYVCTSLLTKSTLFGQYNCLNKTCIESVALKPVQSGET